MQNLRILGKGKTALALKKRFPDATLYDDNDLESFDKNSNDLTIVSPGMPPHNKLVLASKNIISDYDLFYNEKKISKKNIIPKRTNFFFSFPPFCSKW